MVYFCNEEAFLRGLNIRLKMAKSYANIRKKKKKNVEEKTCEVAVRKTDNVVLAQSIQEQVNLKLNRKQNG